MMDKDRCGHHCGIQSQAEGKHSWEGHCNCPECNCPQAPEPDDRP